MTKTFFAAALLALTSTAAAEHTAGHVDMDRPDYDAKPVINGTAVPAGKWPDAVAVLSAQGSCTGTLIAPDVVLTAGHCADPAPTTVIANTTNYSGAGGIRATVKSVTAYPNWENTYDIAVIVLNSPITGVTPRRIGAPCTFSAGGFADSMNVHLVGFGLTDTAGEGNNTTLREASAPIVDADCSSTGKGCSPGALPAGEFIAGGGGTDSCFGDSGGPVYLDTPRGTVVVGAVSRGLDGAATPCGGGGIYVRTDKVLQWIETTAGKPVMQDTCASGNPPENPDPSGPGGGGPGGGGGGGGTGDDERAESAEITGGCSTGTSGTGGALLVGAMLLGGLRRRRR